MLPNFFDSVLQLIVRTSTDLPPDVRAAMKHALVNEPDATRSSQALTIIAQNIDLAADAEGAICQDTGMTKDARGRAVFHKLAEEEKEHLGTLQKRYRELAAQDPQLETRPTFLFFKGAASGLFAEGAEQLRKGVNDEQALLIGIRCERGSHKFFKRYGERFEDSEGKQVFLEFADEERVHLELLIREYKSLRERQGRRRALRRSVRRARSAS